VKRSDSFTAETVAFLVIAVIAFGLILTGNAPQ
jgi:hypothetical protein